MLCIITTIAPETMTDSIDNDNDDSMDIICDFGPDIWQLWHVDKYDNKVVVEWKELIDAWQGGSEVPRSDRISCMIGNDDDDSNDNSLLSALKQSTMNHDKQGDNDVDSDGTVMEVQELEEEYERMARGKREMYAMVLSRAANLGRAWNYSIGIVPFHAMINHHSSPATSN
eukprot:scaffold133245_cov50-Attheya_sp.AAC.3